MDSRVGLEFIIENSDYTSKLALALITTNETVKKQIIELLTALCAYKQVGCNRAIETLENYKSLTNKNYRLKVLVTELENAQSTEYKTALLSFINCLISRAKRTTDGISIRTELINHGLLAVVTNLKSIQKFAPDLKAQIEVFENQKEDDEEEEEECVTQEIENLCSHLSLFTRIFENVSNTPQEITFLNILQHLLRIDSKEAVTSELIWSTIEKFVNRATLIKSQDESDSLLRSASHQKVPQIPSPRKHSLVLSSSPSSPNGSKPLSSAPPPPPPPPLLPNTNNVPQNVPLPPAFPPPPPPSSAHLNTPSNNMNHKHKTTESANDESMKPLPQQEIPLPRSKMKTINWNKIPPNKVLTGNTNVWSLVANNHQKATSITKLNWDEMEGLFCQQLVQSSPKPGNDPLENRRSRKEEITLLDGKRSLNVNIFLKQFRSTDREIIRMIINGDCKAFGLEKLRALMKLEPEFDECEMLKAFDGDVEKLGSAEKFLFQLIQVPNYKLRIECMLLKEEFVANIGYIQPNINAMISAGDDLMKNKALHEVLYMVVLAGNFLNAGGYAGNAAGVKLTSLQKLTEIRANKPNMNLMNYIALQAENNKELLSFANQMNNLENASKMTIEQLSNEISTLMKKIAKVQHQINLPSSEEDIKLQMEDFLQESEKEIIKLQRSMKDLEMMRVRLSDFFCEDSSQFKIEECFKIFYHFCEKFKSAIKENEKRRIQEEQAEIRRKQREEQLTNKRRQFNQYITPSSDSEQKSFSMDPPTISYDIRFSPAMNRRRRRAEDMANNNNADLNFREEGFSPDITPNGTLRRRRSRVLSEEEEDSLMDFLRNSGHDNTSRERKSALGYGSLDRSWSRRARTGSAKTRPELLNVDFGMDRERPVSPSPSPAPVSEDPDRFKHLTEKEDLKPRGISREWRQKIESWLHINEQDEKKNEELRKKMRRAANNRRSIETDTESEKGTKLDILLEEKSQNEPSINLYEQTEPERSRPYQRTQPDWTPSSTPEIIANEKSINPLNNSEMPCNDDELNKQSIYIRVKDEQELEKKTKQQETASKHNSSVYILPSNESKLVNKEEESPIILGQRNKVDIDNENIETPPTVRKSFINTSLRASKTNKAFESLVCDKQDQEHLGQFDRFSSARRTRRFKRHPETNGSVKVETTTPSCPDSASADTNLYTSHHASNTENVSVPQKKEVERSHIISRIGKIGKSMSKISQEDVREAIRSLKSPTPEREWNIKDSFRVAPLTKTSHELNDEGFEETQSLVSDTPSLTTSSCNEDSKLKKDMGSKSQGVVINQKLPTASNKLQTLLTRNQKSLERSRSLRTKANLAPVPVMPPRRTNSLRRPENQSTPNKLVANKRLDVERSNSKTSLGSSRTSLNSAISTNTVKKMPLKSQESNKLQQQLPLRAFGSSSSSKLPATSRISASRSSSSGSSIIGPPIRITSTSLVKKAPSTVNSTLTNKTVRSKISPVSSAGSSKTNDSSLQSSSRPSTTSNFMKPTTATKARQKIVKTK